MQSNSHKISADHTRGTAAKEPKQKIVKYARWISTLYTGDKLHIDEYYSRLAEEIAEVM